MGIQAFVGRNRFVVFATITLALAGLAFGSGVDSQMLPFVLVLLPAIAALVTAALAGGGELGRLGRRISHWRVSPWLYLMAIGLPVAGTLMMVGLAVAAGAPMSSVFSEMSPAALIVPLVVLLPALLEEFGWRGFGIPALGRMPLLGSALVVGIPFTLIHLPLHMPGHLYADLPMWPTVMALVSYSLILGWMFSVSRGSAFLAGLMHAAANGAVPLTWGVDTVRVWEMRGVAFAVLALVLLTADRRTFASPSHDVTTGIRQSQLAPTPTA